MTSLVFDFEDIHKRMLGDLKKVKEPNAANAVCRHCNGTKLRHSALLQRWVACIECEEEEGPF